MILMSSRSFIPNWLRLMKQVLHMRLMIVIVLSKPQPKTLGFLAIGKLHVTQTLIQTIALMSLAKHLNSARF